MTGNEFERITPAQAGPLDINMMDRMEKEKINITSFVLCFCHGKILCVRHIISRMKKDQYELYFRSFHFYGNRNCSWRGKD